MEAELLKLIDSMIEEIETDPRTLIADARVLDMLDRLKAAATIRDDRPIDPIGR